MEDLKFGNWSYSASCSTDHPDIWMIEMKNNEKKWCGRYDLNKHLFLDVLPCECTGSEYIMDSLVYSISIAI